MKTKTTKVIIIIVFLAVAGAFSLVLLHNTRKIKSYFSETKLSFIKTGYPSRGDFVRSIPFLGLTFSKSDVKLISMESGRINSILVRDGERVKKGTVIFQLGGPVISTEMEILKSRAKSLKKRYSLAMRIVSLRREGVKTRIISLDKLKEAEENAQKIKGALVSAEKKLRLFEENTKVRATINGIFASRKVNAGQEVEKGQILGEVIDPANLKIEARIFSRILKSPIGMKAIVITSEGKKLKGKVKRAFPGNIPSGGLVVWIEGSEINSGLSPGEPVRGKLILEIHKNSLSLPASAVVYYRNKAYIFVQKGGRYEKRAVILGLKNNGHVEVISGLKEREKVAILGAYELINQNFNKVFKVPD